MTKSLANLRTFYIVLPSLPYLEAIIKPESCAQKWIWQIKDICPMPFELKTMFNKINQVEQSEQ